MSENNFGVITTFKELQKKLPNKQMNPSLLPPKQTKQNKTKKQLQCMALRNLRLNLASRIYFNPDN